MSELNQRSLPRPVRALLFALIPMACCALYALFQGIAIWDIDPIASPWNDEPMYYAQIAGMAKYGMPLGYFGYDGSTAEIGTLGAWSLFLLLPYIPAMIIFDYAVSTLMWTNLAYMSVAFLLFYLLACPTRRQCVYIFLAVLCTVAVWRYTLSCMSEPIFLAGAVLMAGLTLRLLRCGSSKGLIWIFYCVILYQALCRPYYLAFMLIPLYFQCRSSLKRGLLTFAGCAVLVVALYVSILWRMQSAFFSPTVDLSVLEALTQNGLWAFVRRSGGRLLYTAENVASNIGSLFLGGRASTSQFVGSVYFAVGLCVIAFAVAAIVKLKSQRRGVLTDGVFWLLISSILIVLAMTLAFSLFHASFQGRHWMSVYLFFLPLALILLVPQKPAKRQTAALIALFLLFGFSQLRCVSYDYYFYLPRRGGDFFSKRPVTAEAEKLTQAIELSVDSPWDSTVVYPFGQLSFNYLYYLPIGTGIQFATGEYLIENPSTIEARYILAGKYPQQQAGIIEAGFRIAVEGTEFILYERSGS